MVLEKDCSARTLMDTVGRILADKPGYDKMCIALQKMVVLDSAERLCDMIAQLAATKRR